MCVRMGSSNVRGGHSENKTNRVPSQNTHLHACIMIFVYTCRCITCRQGHHDANTHALYNLNAF